MYEDVYDQIALFVCGNLELPDKRKLVYPDHCGTVKTALLGQDARGDVYDRDDSQFVEHTRYCKEQWRQTNGRDDGTSGSRMITESQTTGNDL